MRTRAQTPGRGGRLAPLAALALANARFWPTVAPVAAAELRRWRSSARAIVDPTLRALALEKLEREAFNAQVAATLATLTPRPYRARSVMAIVAYELLFDYLDGRTEQLGGDVIAEASALFVPFTAALSLGSAPVPEITAGDAPEDRAYLYALSRSTHESFQTLPGAASVSTLACGAAERCAQAQTRIHAAGPLGTGQLREWAQQASAGSGLDWREYASGCASSVLAAHALIAAAGARELSGAEAQAIDHAYLAIGAVITILDSLVDEAEDEAHGRTGFMGLYEPGELLEVLPALVGEALTRSARAPWGAHHAMTLAGVLAYYTSHPGARRGQARQIVPVVRRVLSPTVWPALAVMGAWRVSKRAHAALEPRWLNVRGRASGAAERRRS